MIAHVAMYVLQSLGNTRTPMRLALYGNVLNALGNYLLLFGGAIQGVTEPCFRLLGFPVLQSPLCWRGCFRRCSCYAPFSAIRRSMPG